MASPEQTAELTSGNRYFLEMVADVVGHDPEMVAGLEPAAVDTCYGRLADLVENAPASEENELRADLVAAFREGQDFRSWLRAVGQDPAAAVELVQGTAQWLRVENARQQEAAQASQAGRVAARAAVHIAPEVENAVDKELTAASLDEAVTDADITRQYFNEIGKRPLLNAEQEVALSKDIEAGLYATELLRKYDAGELAEQDFPAGTTLHDLQAMAREGARAKNEMLESNLRLVVSVAKRYRGSGLSLLDLIQEGNLGLVRAVEKFDYTKGFKFSTYATWWVRQSITRGIADHGRTIRVPVHMVEQINKLNRARRELSDQLGRAATSEELAVQMDTSVADIKKIEKADRSLPVSMDKSLDGDSGKGQTESYLGDFIVDEDELTPDDMVVHKGLREDLANLLATLPSREEKIIQMRFGFMDKVYTLDEVAQEEGVSRERIRQIEKKVLQKLRAPERNERLRSYWQEED